MHPTKKKTTPVTLANVWGSKKGRKIKFDNLRVLLDSGCSDSIASLKYGKSSKKKGKTKYFTTGSVQLKHNIRQIFCFLYLNLVIQNSLIGNSTSQTMRI